MIFPVFPIGSLVPVRVSHGRGKGVFCKFSKFRVKQIVKPYGVGIKKKTIYWD